MTFGDWVRRFEDNAERRRIEPEPAWDEARPLDRAVIRSLQRFQAGENGDGASLIRKSELAGDADYLAAVRMFVAEEQNHARLLEHLLVSAGASVIDGHWSDRAFVALRRALGLRLELMTLMVAEVVALRYYRAVRDGTADPLLTDVAGRILADEQAHVPFHTHRLREGFAGVPRPARAAVAAGWWVLLVGAACVVAYDHGPALRLLNVGRPRFVAETTALFRPVVLDVLGDGPTGEHAQLTLRGQETHEPSTPVTGSL